MGDQEGNGLVGVQGAATTGAPVYPLVYIVA